LQVSLQYCGTSPTQIESHLVVQQYESFAQTLVTQASQPLLSFVPVLHSGCVHVPPPPPQVWPQTELTSPTQIESHAVVQQYESAAQMLAAHESQLPVSAPPVEQIGCEQVPPPPVQVPLEPQVWPLPHVPHEPPQPSLPQVLPVHCGVQPVEPHWPADEQVWPVAHVPHVPPQPSLPHILPVQFGVQVLPPPSAEPFGEPLPVGPSQPAPALHIAPEHEPFDPLVTSKKFAVWPYEYDGPALLMPYSA
jgi:homeobox protein ESX1